MYNRYIHQNDGTYQRRPVPDHPPVKAPPPPSQKQPPSESQPPPLKPPQHGSAVGFLRQLLPKGFDTGDLIIVLLLLLMAGDCEEEKNTALLTLSLYFFM